MDLTIYSDVPNETPGSYCRFCFRETELVPIFHPTTVEPVNRQLLDIIVECTDIRLTADRDFPSSACQNCLQVLQEFYHFRQRTKEYDRLIRAKAMALRIEPEVLIVKQEPLEDDTLESVRRQYLADQQAEQERQQKEEEETQTEDEVDDEEHEIGSSSSTLTADESREEDFFQQQQQQNQQLEEQPQHHPSLSAIFKMRTTSGSSGSKSATTVAGTLASSLEENRCMVCGEKFSLEKPG